MVIGKTTSFLENNIVKVHCLVVVDQETLSLNAIISITDYYPV